MLSLEGIDHGLLYGLNQGRQDWLSSIMVLLGELSGNTSIAFLTCVLTIACFLKRQFRIRAVLYPLAILSGALAVWGMKRLVERDRPNIVPWVVPEQSVQGFSFPSGHATMNTLLGILMIAVLFQMKWRLGMRVGGAFLIVAWVLAVGFNRIYLGVHWPTDVLGGWCLGGLIGLAWLKLISLLEQPKTAATHSDLAA